MLKENPLFESEAKWLLRELRLRKRFIFVEYCRPKLERGAFAGADLERSGNERPLIGAVAGS
jgi:hypothetical protein